MDTRADEKAAKQIESKIGRLVAHIDEGTANDVLDVYDLRIRELRSQLKVIQQRISNNNHHYQAPPPPLDADRIKAYLNDLRALMPQDIEAAYEAIRTLTGSITITQEPIAGRKRGARWIATFNPNQIRSLRRVAGHRDCPETITLEFLCDRNWIMPIPAEVRLERIPLNEQKAAEFKELLARSVSAQVVASAHGTTRVSVRQSITFAEAGQRPRFRAGQRTGAQKGLIPKYKQIAADVARLKAKRWSYPKIIGWLKGNRGITALEPTVARAWDFAHPSVVRAAVKRGVTPAARRRFTFLPADVHTQIRELLHAGEPVGRITSCVGCSVNTVRRAKKVMATGSTSIS